MFPSLQTEKCFGILSKAVTVLKNHTDDTQDFVAEAPDNPHKSM
jgi:hypothetical protein